MVTNLMTKNDFLLKNALWTASQLDSVLKKAKALGGASDCGVVFQGRGRAVLIDEPKFLAWVSHALHYDRG